MKLLKRENFKVVIFAEKNAKIEFKVTISFYGAKFPVNFEGTTSPRDQRPTA
jgi:hypothetical protein